MPSTRSLRSHAGAGSGQDANTPTRTGRLTRGADPAPSVTVSLSSQTSPPGSRSIRLTVKMSSSKLRQVTNSRNSRATASARHNIFTEDPVVHGKRSSRNNKSLREISEDDDDDNDVDDDDVELDEEDDDEIADSDDAAVEDEELDAEGDLDMDDDTPRPAVSRRNARQPAAATSKSRPLKSVEQKEMELADDDDELSELESDADGEPDDTMLQDEEMGEAGEEDEDEDEEEEGVEEEEDNDDGLGSDDDSALDLTKLTKRQRGSLGTDFLQLPMGKKIRPSF
jgi:Ino eighty subunit 2